MRGTFRFWATAFLLSAAVLLGGGGSPSVGFELALQLVFAASLVVLAIAWAARPALFQGAPPVSAWLIACLILAVPLLQLMPLPPSVWQALPGRGMEIASLKLAGSDAMWMPLSLTPDRTLAGLLALVPPVVLLLLASSLAVPQRRGLLLVVLALGAASILLGAAQLSAGAGTAFRLFDYTHEGYLVGFQASRNIQVDFLLLVLLCVPALAAFAPGTVSPALRMALVPGALLLVLAAVFFTGSRAGIAITPIALGLTAFSLRHQFNRLPIARLAAAGAAVVALAAGVLLFGNGANTKVLERFALTEDGRQDLWIDTTYAIGQHWPVGSGMGSFIPVFHAAERLETLDPSLPVRAHNDWLEFTLEAGLPGIAVLVAIGLLLGRALYLTSPYRRAKEGSGDPLTWYFAVGALTVLALHSIVDYPLRSMSMACLAAVAAALALPGPRRNPTEA